MADEPQHDQSTEQTPHDSPQTVSEEECSTTATTSGAGAGAGADDDDGGVEDDEVEGEPEQPPRTIAVRNAELIGQLVLHYESRDVLVALDGDAAVRLLAMFAQRREGGLADVLHPQLSSASSGWLVLDLAEPLAMSWLPGLPTKRPRTAIDPALGAA